MAAAIVPLILGLAPTVVNLIAALVHKSAPVAEATLGAGTGAAKFGLVFGDVVAALGKAALAGQIDKTLPPDPVIQLIIQAVVTSMQLSGLLGATAPADPVTVATVTPSAQSAQSVALRPGMSVLVTA